MSKHIEKKPTKKAKKKPSKKKEVTKEKKLSSKELLDISNNHAELSQLNMEVEVLKRDSIIIQSKKEILSKDLIILDYQYGDKTRKIKDINAKKKNIENNNREYMEKLKSKYDITNGFGYDPETGILRED